MRVWREYWQAFGIGYGLLQAAMAALWLVSGFGLFGGIAWMLLT